MNKRLDNRKIAAQGSVIVAGAGDVALPLKAPYSAAGYAAAAVGSSTLTGLKGTRGLRGLLLGSAAAATLMLATPRGAYAECTVSGDGETVTCTGDIDAGPPGALLDDYIDYNTTTANNLFAYDLEPTDGELAPAPGNRAIAFVNDEGDDVYADIDLGSTRVLTSGNDAVYVGSTVGDDVEVIVTGSNEIQVDATDDDDAIRVRSANSGPGTRQSGNLDVTNDVRLDVNGGGDQSDGIDAYTYAYSTDGANATSGDVTVDNSGSIDVSDGRGLVAGSDAESYGYNNLVAGASSGDAVSGVITVTNTATIIDADEDAIQAFSHAYTYADNYSGAAPASATAGYARSGPVTVNSTGNVFSDSKSAIYASSIADAAAYTFSTDETATATAGDATTGVTTVTNDGLLSGAYGIYAESLASTDARAYGEDATDATAGDATAGGVTVDSIGSIIADDEDGIYVDVYADAYAYADSEIGPATALAGDARTGAVSVTNDGLISADQYGIYVDVDAESVAEAFSGGAGEARATSGDATTGAVTIANTGDIIASEDDAIYADVDATSYAEGFSSEGLARATSGDAVTGPVSVTSAGLLSGNDYGIYVDVNAYSGANAEGFTGATARSNLARSGAVTISNSGDIFASENDGIYVDTDADSTARAYTKYGDADARAVNATGGNISITSDGAIVGDDYGIYVNAQADSFARAVTGFLAQTGGDATARSGSAVLGSVTINNTGNITAVEDDGIYVEHEAASGAEALSSKYGDAVATGGNVTVGNVRISNNGSIVAADGDGIESDNDGYAFAEGFAARGDATATSGDVTIGSSWLRQIGDVTSLDGEIEVDQNGFSEARAEAKYDAVATTGDVRVGAIDLYIRGDVVSADDGVDSDNSAGGFAFAEGIYGNATARVGTINSGSIRLDMVGDVTSLGSGGDDDGLALSSFAEGYAEARAKYSADAEVAKVYSGSVWASLEGDVLAVEGDGLVINSRASSSAFASGEGLDGPIRLAEVARAFTEGATAANVSVMTNGDITAPEGAGIYAESDARNRAVARGKYSANARSGSARAGDVRVMHQGGDDGIFAERDGINAFSGAYSSAYAFSEAEGLPGANAFALSGNARSGDVWVKSSGDIVSLEGDGIDAASGAEGFARAREYGADPADTETVSVEARTASSGDVMVENEGDIFAAEGGGISAVSFAHSEGFALSRDGTETLEELIAENFAGITYGGGVAGHVDVFNSGDINARYFGIIGVSDGGTKSNDVGIFTSGDVTVTRDFGSVFTRPDRISAAILAVSGGGSAKVNADGSVSRYGEADKTKITLDGAAVTTAGDYVHGTVSFGANNQVTLMNEASVDVFGEGSVGIIVGPEVYAALEFDSDVEGFGIRQTFGAEGSRNLVRVNRGTSVTSAQDFAILDLEDVTAPEGIRVLRRPAPTPVVTDGSGLAELIDGVFVASAMNQTEVRVGGTVVGNGTDDAESVPLESDGAGDSVPFVGPVAVELNGANDKFELQPGFDVTGLVLGGEEGETGEPGEEGDVFALGGEGQEELEDTLDIGLVDGNDTPDEFSEQYLQFERFQKENESRFFLTGENDEIDTFRVLNGELFVNAEMPNTFFPVTGDALLGGDGTIGSFHARDRSIISPGAGPGEIGTLRVEGTARFGSNSTYRVDLSPFDDDDVDLLSVGGLVTIDGGTIQVVASPGMFALSSFEYTIIDSDLGPVDGEFDDIEDNVPDLDFVDFYPDSRVVLRLTEASDGNFSNKDNAGAALFGAGLSSLNFAESLQERAGLETFTFVPSVSPLGYVTEDEARSGAVAAVIGTADLAVDLPEAVPVIVDANRFGLWIGALGDRVDVDDDDGFEADTVGLMGGAEYLFGNAVSASLVGVGVGYTKTDVDVSDGEGEADINTGHIGLYGSHDRGALNLSGAVAYSWSDFDLDRRLFFGEETVSAEGEADGDTVSASIVASYDVAQRLGMERLRLAPTVRLNALSADRDGFDEDSEAELFALDVDEDELQQFIPAIGVTLGATTTTANGLTVKADLAVFYEHVFGDNDVDGSSTIVLPGDDATFISTVEGGGRDRLSLGAGVGVSFTERLSGHVRYDGSFGEDVTHHRASGGVTVRF